jgi:hypothetical protein
MTRRERLERKLEKREDWAAGRDRKSEQARGRADAATAGIPFGQPILVGHHSEKRHRRALDRSDRAMRATIEHGDMAAHHRSKAAGLESQLDGSIFSDDPDALEALAARIEALEAERAEKKALGAAWRKAKKPKSTFEPGWVKVAEILGVEVASAAIVAARMGAASEESFGLSRGPVPSYSLTNLGGNIRRLKKRAVEIERRQARDARTEAAGGVLIERHGPTYCSVTFSEKPDREVLTALKAAGFRWGSGSWCGEFDQIPEEVTI